MPPTSLTRRQFLQILLWSLFAMRPSSALAKAAPEIAAPNKGARAAFEQSLRAFVDCSNTSRP